jgi:hypothetical protein
MSQVNNAAVGLSSHLRERWTVSLSVLAALAAIVAVALVLAIDGGSGGTSVAQGSEPATRSDGGPEESLVAASVGPAGTSAPAGRPDESKVAAAIGAPTSNQ